MLVTTYNNDSQIKVYQTNESEFETETPYSVCKALEKQLKGKGEWVGFGWWRDNTEWMSIDQISHGKGSKATAAFDAILNRHLEAIKNTTPIKI